MQPRTFFALALLAGIAGAGVAFAGPASAQTGERIGAHLFEKVDANGDGRVDAAEMAAARGTRFDRVDRDGDGFVTAAELEKLQTRIQRAAKAIEGGVAARFDRFDADGDGRVSRAEFTTGQSGPLVELLDADGDGAISQAEFSRLAAALKTLR
jgi:Ca2+-binding EF-hand superfamily protein